MKWKHDDLLNDLAEHLNTPEKMVWRDMQMGPSGSKRPDVYVMRKSYSNPKPLSYEIKVSVSDYRSDVTSGKWQSYLKFSCGVYFCVPQGLISKQDLPAACGLMIRGENGWKSLKAPVLNPCTLPQDTMLKLLIDGIERADSKHRTKAINTYLLNCKVREHFGEDVAQTITDLVAARANLRDIQSEVDSILNGAKQRADILLKSANESAERSKKELSDGIKRLCTALGLPEENHNEYSLLRALRLTENRINVDSRVRTCKTIVTQLKDSLRWAENELRPIVENEGR
ncbi:MmcB family DNA repair protein [Hahella ganghwensis]|uniref:MmcB family DNA repair protein n=1 Tax=Hahella ganghwensis TaxID=286420 RepID=UPI00036CE8B2|nr:MmcB family DNA repair protein [Hahella ganghwensis]